MPQGDQTGPTGQGPMTGRGLGYCAGYSTLGCVNSSFGRRMGGGFRRGRGFGFRAGFFQQIPQQTQPVILTEKEEKQILESELKDLKEEMQEIEKRLKSLKS